MTSLTHLAGSFYITFLGVDVIVILLEIFGLDLLDLGFLAGFAKGVAFLGELPEIGTNVIF